MRHVNIMPESQCKRKNVEIGSYDNQVEVASPAHMVGKTYGCMNIGATICLDVCIADEVQKIWSEGFTTTGACCGHGKRQGYIGVYISSNADLAIKGA